MKTDDTRLFEARCDLHTAAECVRMPVSTLRVWASGSKDCKALLELPEPRFLSFINLKEVFVLHASRKNYKIVMPNIRHAMKYAEKQLGVSQPLASDEFETDGVDMFIKEGLRCLNASRGGQVAMDNVHAAFQRIEWNKGRPVALFPIFRAQQIVPVRSIKISHFVAFGKPVIAATSVPVASVGERFNAGESLQTLADDYELSIDLLEEALRAELVFAA